MIKTQQYIDHINHFTKMDFIQKRSVIFIEENNEIDKYLIMINYENITESV